VISEVWLYKSDRFQPGAELFRSDRIFETLGYTVSHSQLLLSSNAGVADEPPETTVQILFKPVRAMRLERLYHGLAIRYATVDETDRIRSGLTGRYQGTPAHVFVLESGGVEGYVISDAVGWREGVLARMQPSLFRTIDEFDEVWPTSPVAGMNAGLDLASPAEVVHAFTVGLDDGARRDRYRLVHVLVAVNGDRRSRHTVGVFLAEADAQEAAVMLRPHVADCWVELTPMVL
jgi:hypothetical protein